MNNNEIVECRKWLISSETRVLKHIGISMHPWGNLLSEKLVYNGNKEKEKYMWIQNIFIMPEFYMNKCIKYIFTGRNRNTFTPILYTFSISIPIIVNVILEQIFSSEFCFHKYLDSEF